jgi:NPCBM/NEW2 domain
MHRHLCLGVLAVVSCVCASTASALDIKLADIVGGGNGTGTGTVGNGIDPSTGGTAPPPMFQISQPNDTNSYHSSVVNFVDGVFIPDGGAGSVTLDSAGHGYAGFPNTDSLSWDRIKDGPFQNGGVSLSGVDYSSGSHAMIGFHANKGITFDLLEIAAAHPGMYASSFTAVAGITHQVGGFAVADWWVFVDGVLHQSQLNTPGGVGIAINVPLNGANQFLTLVSTDAGDGFLSDQIIFGDPVLHLQVPEPSTITLAACGLMALTGLARRARRNRDV